MEGKAGDHSQDSNYEPSGKISPSNKESTPPIATPGNSQRSEADPNSPSPSLTPGSTPKRQRTTPSPMPFVSASPPGFVTLEEIMKAANSMSQMALAHEIAVDDDFHLEKTDLPANSIQKKIKEITHQAFWDLLKEELEEDPPQYDRALMLLEEIKEWLLSLLLPHQTRTQQEIKDKLDTTVIRQQIENNALDLHSYSQYIISMMARLCAPERDEKIRELTGLKDVIPLYKGIFETLELMKIDMANFTIRMSRPHIAACSAEYERKKFDDYLKVTPDGLRNTREWLWRNYEKLSSELAASGQKPETPAIISSVLIRSFIELLEWDEKNPWPETLAMDQQRFQQLKIKLRDVELLSSSILVSFNHNIGPVASNVEFRKKLKDNVTVVWGEDVADADVSSKLPAVSAQIIEEINSAVKAQQLSELTDEVSGLIAAEVVSLSSADHRVRKIIHIRLVEFLRQVISSEVARPTQIPAGLSLFKNEIAGLAGRFARLVSHNRAVFAQHYADLIKAFIDSNE